MTILFMIYRKRTPLRYICYALYFYISDLTKTDVNFQLRWKWYKVF